MEAESLFFGEAVAKKAELQQNLEVYGHNATGKTSDAIRQESHPLGFEIYGPRQVYTLVYGRKPTANFESSGRPLIEAIKEWIAAKGLSINPYAVTAKIHREGTALFISIQKGNQPSKLLEDVFGSGYAAELGEKVNETLYLGLRKEIAKVNTDIQKK